MAQTKLRKEQTASELTTKVGTPVDNQVAVWTGDGTLEGDADLTWSGTTLAIAGSQTITVADTANAVGLTINQNDVTNQPYVAKFISAGGVPTNTGVVLIQTTGAFSPAHFEIFTNGQVTSGNSAGGFIWKSLDSASNTDIMAQMDVFIGDNTSTSEDSYLFWSTRIAGTYGQRLAIGNGVNGVSVGNSGASGVLSSFGSQDLILQTGNPTTGTITITDGANGNITIAPNGTGDVALGSADLTMTGSLAATGARVTKGWFTDLESTNMPTVGGTSLSSTFLGLAGGTMTGNITLGENASVDLDPALSADGKYSGICITGTAGAALAFGDLIYLAAADSRWELADADAASTSDRLLGICVLAAAGDGSATKILLQGNIRADAAFPALTIGSPVYVGETPGDVQTAIPTGADAVIRRVGFALTADELYFNPSMDAQTVVA